MVRDFSIVLDFVIVAVVMGEWPHDFHFKFKITKTSSLRSRVKLFLCRQQRHRRHILKKRRRGPPHPTPSVKASLIDLLLLHSK